MTRKVLQINVTANVGSTGRIAGEIGDVVLSGTWESYIAYGRSSRPGNSSQISIGGKASHWLHGLESRLLDRHGLASAGATRRFLKRVEEISPDIVHLHNIHGYYLNYPLLFDYLVQKDIPVVWTLHDCWPFTGHCCYYTSEQCAKWKTGCERCPLLSSYPASLGIDRSYRNYRDKKRRFTSPGRMTIVCVSEWLTREVQQSFLNKYPVRTISNGVDTKVFSPGKEDLRAKYGYNDEFIILGVANVWDRRKGLEDFIRLSGLLSEDERLMLVGLTPSQLETLPPHIRGIGRTEDVEELAGIYSLADVHVSLSDQETFGLTIAESLACGTPAVVYDTTACPEVISEDTGMAVPLHDIAGVAEAIRKIKQRGKSSYTKACRKRALDKYDKDVKYREYIRLYEQMLEK